MIGSAAGTIANMGDAFLPGSAASHLLAQLLKEAQQNPTFATTDGAHDTFGNHDNVPAKVFVNDLHTAYLISP
jgi:hypothetical protein